MVYLRIIAPHESACQALELLDGADLVPDAFDAEEHPPTGFISDPDFFSRFVAYIAGTAGILSLTSAKSGALIGVLISVTTIPVGRSRRGRPRMKRETEPREPGGG